jgi:hypothetical protein
VLAGAWFLRGSLRGHVPSTALDADATPILEAIVPVLLDGALPAAPADHRARVQGTVANVRTAIAGLPPAAQEELAQLFTILAWPPTRLAFAGLTQPWSEASHEEVGAVLARWRMSRIDLRRSAYDALHQLVLAAWYAAPESWVGIGYPGPPELPS